MGRLRRRPSPAVVVACLALAVALGGTGYSAIVLPANSVGTKQLRNGAVVAAKVKPHSLVARNFMDGQLPAGPAGPKGADGLAGAAGPAGKDATKLFATVKKKAGPGGGIELGPSSGVSGQPKKEPGVGVYSLTLNQDVSNCAVLAIPGGKDIADGEVSAKTSGGNKVVVQTFAPDGSGSTDLDAFTVALFC
jgi:hypothetical protein